MLRIILVMLYPLLMHVSILYQIPVAMGLAFLSLSTAIFIGALGKKNKWAWAVYLLLNSLVFLLAFIQQAIYLFYLPPVLIPSLLLVVFFRSLLPGNEPLVTDIGEKARGPLTMEMRAYTRSITILWVVVFAVMVANSILMPIFASPETWSLFANGINYIFCGVLFLGEFYFRQWRFPEHDHPGFIQYVQIVIAAQIQSHGKKT